MVKMGISRKEKPMATIRQELRKDDCRSDGGNEDQQDQDNFQGDRPEKDEPVLPGCQDDLLALAEQAFQVGRSHSNSPFILPELLSVECGIRSLKNYTVTLYNSS